jgi:hypothetical protein
MKKTITFFGLTLFGYLGFSQDNVNNPSFENWEQLVVKDSLEFWTTSTSEYQSYGNFDVNNTYQITNAQSGNYAMHLETIYYDNGNGTQDTIFGYIVKNNVTDNGFIPFSYTDQIDNLKGYFKCNIIGNDTAFAVIQLFNSGVMYGSAIYPFTGNVNAWTEFNAPIIGGNLMAPDSVFIGFSSSHFNDPLVVELGSWLEIDNISFSFNGNTTTAIPNNDFENMVQETYEIPSDWLSYSQNLYVTYGSSYLTKSTDAVDGIYSARIENTPDAINDIGMAFMTNGYPTISGIQGGIPFTAIATQFTFQYKYIPSGVDVASAQLTIWKDGVPNYVDSVIAITSSGIWTTETVDITYNQAPDSVRLSFVAGSNVGSVLYLDDIKFVGGDVNVNELSLNEYSIYPNPSNQSFKIEGVNNAQIKIYSISGQIVFSSQSNNKTLLVDTYNWHEGIYLIQIVKNNELMTKKIAVQH